MAETIALLQTEVPFIFFSKDSGAFAVYDVPVLTTIPSKFTKTVKRSAAPFFSMITA